MQFIDPQVYIWHEWWFSFEYLWSKLDEMPSFKGLHVCAIDSSIIEIPNTKLTRDDFGIPEKTQTYKDTFVARISCMVDAHWDFIISSNLTSKNVDEITNALIPFRWCKKQIGLNKNNNTIR